MSKHYVTSGDIKEWVGQFGDSIIVEYEMDCVNGITYLTIPLGTITEKFNLKTGEATSEEEKE